MVARPFEVAEPRWENLMVKSSDRMVKIEIVSSWSYDHSLGLLEAKIEWIKTYLYSIFIT